MKFDLYPLQFDFVAREPLYFPPGQAANILRGALGTMFRKLACVPECPGANQCDSRESCPYARTFEPAGSRDVPSGLTDWPRPFVFRARHLNGKVFGADEPFAFNVNLFSLDHDVLSCFVLAFAALAREGLGPRRVRAMLQRVVSDDQILYEATTQVVKHTIQPASLALGPSRDAASRIRVSFLTPTELKQDSAIADRPEFPILFGRLRDRIATLSRLYGRNTLAIDFLGTSARSLAVRMTRFEVARYEAERRSSRTGRTHSIGGFVGQAEYEGELAEFLPFLTAGQWVGVGRQSVWGKGEIVTEVLA